MAAVAATYIGGTVNFFQVRNATYLSLCSHRRMPDRTHGLIGLGTHLAGRARACDGWHKVAEAVGLGHNGGKSMLGAIAAADIFLMG